MFTGIIESVGTVKSLQRIDGDVRIQIAVGGLDMSDVKLGDSIATSGICLTVIDFGTDWFSADISVESLNRTIVQNWRVGTRVNLEKALLPTTRLGGHIVSGHVDGVAEISLKRQDARSIYFEVTCPTTLAKYLSEKGSITIDGISLTINHLRGNIVSLNLVPHTAEKTTIGEWQVGTKVNIEVDVLARYIERLLLGDKACQTSPSSNIDMAFLAQHGFMK
ncbi:riboflavin synthase [Moraxella sp. ZY210820]|uniref:riboflavin synthase n=1 Tax=unclassified Moraxella TaxID=2685852 RepID=UPI00272F0545|nr:riboflavin synthase [Moraxella sp. ZY210820]WLF83977.1 riboflavin synthase [Moraxella sp. ZY210820]